MRKLTLNLDALAVDSFEPDTAALGYAGTVRAHDGETDASNCATCDTCQGDNCKGLGNHPAA
jgi:hypothetical protein